MHHVTNKGEATASFWASDDHGQRRLIRLAPGQEGNFNIDPNQPRFQEKRGLVVTEAKPEPKAKSKPADSAPVT